MTWIDLGGSLWHWHAGPIFGCLSRVGKRWWLRTSLPTIRDVMLKSKELEAAKEEAAGVIGTWAERIVAATRQPVISDHGEERMAQWEATADCEKHVMRMPALTLTLYRLNGRWRLWGHGTLLVDDRWLASTDLESAKSEALALVREWCRSVLTEIGD